MWVRAYHTVKDGHRAGGCGSSLFRLRVATPPYGKTLPTNQAGPPGTVTRTKTSSHLPSASTAHRRGSTCDQYLSPAFPSRIQLQVSSLLCSRAFTAQIPPRWSPNTGTSASFTPYLRHRGAQVKHRLELSPSSNPPTTMAPGTSWALL